MLTKKNQNAFTLIELIIVIVIVGIIMAGTSTVLLQHFRAYLAGKNLISLSEQGTIAIERISRDIRAVASSGSITTATNTQFTFSDLDGDTISYAKSGSQIIRTFNSVPNVLADNVANLTFNYFDSSGNSTTTKSQIRYITVNLGLAYQEASSNFYTTIYPRNLE